MIRRKLSMAGALADGTSCALSLLGWVEVV
jgi:hypothetical protein